ncbi:MAG: histidinol dehydrogenase, partial [Methermicoccaceae archaeon]
MNSSNCIPIVKLSELSEDEIYTIIERRDLLDEVHDSVANIIRRVMSEGDSALIDLTRQFDGVDVTSLKVSEEDIEASLSEVSP